MKKIFWLISFLMVFVTACNSPEPSATLPPTLSAIPVQASSTLNLPTHTPSLTLLPPLTEQPTQTITPSPSSIPTMSPIGWDNVRNLNVFASVNIEGGMGWSLSWSPRADFLALITVPGIIFLETQTFEKVGESKIEDNILSTAFLDDHRLAYTTGSLPGIQVIDVPSGEFLEQLPFDFDQPYDFSIARTSPQKNLLAVWYFHPEMTGQDEIMTLGTVRIWNISSGTVLKTIDNRDEIFDTDFSPDGKWLWIIGAKNRFELYDTSTFTQVLNYSPTGAIWDVAFDPDGKQVILLEDNSLRSLNIQSGLSVVFKTFEGNPRGIVFLPDHGYAVADLSGKIDFIAVNTGEQKSKDFQSDSSFMDFIFHPSGKVLAIAERISNSLGIVYFVANGVPLTATPRPPTETPIPTVPPTLAPTPTPRPTGTPISVAEAIRSGDIPVITLENADKLEHVANFVIGQEVNDVFWSPDGKKLIFINLSEGVDIYTFSYAQGLQDTQIVPAWDTDSFAISPDGAKIAKRSTTGQFEIFDTLTSELLQVVGGEVNNNYGASIRWSPFMDVLATMYYVPMGVGASEIRVYDLNTGQQAGAYGREDILQTDGLVFSPGGSLLATTSGLDGSTYVWNRNTGKIAFALYGTLPIFSQNGQMIVTRGTDTVFIYSAADGSSLTSLDAPLQSSDDLAESAFSPDSTLFVTTGDNLSFWSIPDSTFVTEFGADDPYTHAVFSPDGKLLVTIRGEGASTRVIIWAVLP